MKLVPSLTAALLLGVAACSPSGGEAPAGNASANAAATAAVDLAAVETEVRNFIETYNGYYGANDVDPYFASFDPSLTQWFPSGRADLPGYEKSWREGVAKGGGNTSVKVTDLQVQVAPSGDAAVATYVLEVVPRRDGKPVDRVDLNQETDVLFKKDGAWKIVHVNYSPVRPPRPAAN